MARSSEARQPQATRTRVFRPCALQPGVAMAGATAALIAATLGCVVDYRLGSRPESDVVRVHADRAWNDSGVDVGAGTRLRIDYLSGAWSPWAGESFDAIGSGGDPRCDCNRMAGVSHAALIGRLGDGEAFFVGDHWEQVVGEGGRLFLGINDSRVGDNAGWLEVVIRQGE